MVPTSSIPSAVPSLTGLVVSIEMKKLVSTPLSNKDVDEIVDSISKELGVDQELVDIEVDYNISGVVDTSSLPENMSTAEVLDTITQALVDQFDVHPKDVSVIKDPETGLIEYTISNDNGQIVQNIQEALKSQDVKAAIQNTLSEVGIVVDDITSDDDISVNVAVTVDADNVSKDLHVTEAIIENNFREEGWTIDMQSKKIFLYTFSRFEDFVLCFEIIL